MECPRQAYVALPGRSEDHFYTGSLRNFGQHQTAQQATIDHRLENNRIAEPLRDQSLGIGAVIDFFIECEWNPE